MNCNGCPIKQVASEKSLEVYADLLPCSDCKEWGKHHAELLRGKRLGKVERSILLQLAERGKVCSNDFVTDDSRSDRVKVLRAINTLHECGLVLCSKEKVEVSTKSKRYWSSKVDKWVRTCELSLIGMAMMVLHGVAMADNKRLRWRPDDIYNHAVFMNDDELFSKYIDTVKHKKRFWEWKTTLAAMLPGGNPSKARQEVEKYTAYLSKLEGT